MLDSNQFRFGKIPPNQSREGFAYIETDPAAGWSYPYYEETGWSLYITISTDGREPIAYTRDFGGEPKGKEDSQR